MLQYVVVLLWLAADKPCPPATVPPPQGCLDGMVRMSGPLPLNTCRSDVSWWNWYIRQDEANDTLDGKIVGDTGAAICVPVEGD